MTHIEVVEMLEAEWRDRIKAAVLAEREACAEVGKYALPNHSDLGLVVEAAIRARGQA